MVQQMQQSGTSWMDIFYQMDLDHNGKISSYEVYVHLSRDLKLTKKLSMKILKDIDFNFDGYATLEEWMRYENILPKSLKVNTVYHNKSDFQKKLFQTLEYQGDTWVSIFKNCLQPGMLGVPAKTLMIKLVGDMHLPKANTKQLLQEIDADGNGIITEKDWLGYFKEDGIRDERIKELIFDEAELVLAAKADIASQTQGEADRKGGYDLGSLGIFGRLGGFGPNDNDYLDKPKKDENYGVSMPMADYVLHVESDIKAIQEGFNFMQNSNTLNGLQKMFTSSSPENQRQDHHQIPESPTAKRGPLNALNSLASNPNFKVDGVKPVPTRVDSQMVDEKGKKSPEKFTSFVQSDGNPNKSKDHVVALGQRSDEFAEDGGFDSFTPGNNVQQDGFQEGFDELSVGYERSFTEDSETEENTYSSINSHQQVSPSCSSSLPLRQSSPLISQLSEAIATVSFMKSSIPLVQLVDQLHCQTPEISRKAISQLLRHLEVQETGSVDQAEWSNFKQTFEKTIQTAHLFDFEEISQLFKEMCNGTLSVCLPSDTKLTETKTSREETENTKTLKMLELDGDTNLRCESRCQDVLECQGINSAIGVKSGSLGLIKMSIPNVKRSAGQKTTKYMDQSHGVVTVDSQANNEKMKMGQITKSDASLCTNIVNDCHSTNTLSASKASQILKKIRSRRHVTPTQMQTGALPLVQE